MTFTSGTTTVDVGSTDLTIDVTLNGAAISAANTGDLDEGSIELRDPATGAVIVDFPGVWDDSPDQPLTPFTFHDLAHALSRGPRQRPQRHSIQIHEVFG